MAEQRYFQYLAGERQGEVLVFDRVETDDDLIFITFKDQSRCNEELILPINEREWNGKLMAEIESPQNCWTFDEKWVGREKERWSKPEDSPDGERKLVSPAVVGKKKVTPKPPRRSSSNFGQISTPAPTPAVTPVNGLIVQQGSSIDASDPVYMMMDKARKFDTEVTMDLTISLPTKSLYDVAKESFDEGGEKVIEYIISNLDNQKLKDSLKLALKIAYNDAVDPKHIKESTRHLEEPIAVEEPKIRAASPDEIKELGDGEQKKRIELEESEK